MRKLALAFCLGLALATLPRAALAEWSNSNGTTDTVGPIDSGPVVSHGSAGYDPSGISATSVSTTTQPSGLAPSENPGPGYTYRPIPYDAVCPSTSYYLTNNGTVVLLPCGFQSACPAGETGYYVYDPGGNNAGTICVPNSTPAPNLGPNPTPVQLAQAASSRQPWPRLALGVSPGTGLTGLASWFWVGGSTQMPDATATTGVLTVRVRATFVDCIWEFGDGSGYDSGAELGQPYPAASDVRHVYRTDTYAMPNGYQVDAVLRFDVRYSINGGPWTELGVKAKAYTAPYQVNQLQPQAVSVQ